MKTFKGQINNTKLTQQLLQLDNETIANIFITVLNSRNDSAIFRGIEKTLQFRLDELKNVTSDPDQPELF